MTTQISKCGIFWRSNALPCFGYAVTKYTIIFAEQKWLWKLNKWTNPSVPACLSTISWINQSAARSALQDAWLIQEVLKPTGWEDTISTSLQVVSLQERKHRLLSIGDPFTKSQFCFTLCLSKQWMQAVQAGKRNKANARQSYKVRQTPGKHHTRLGALLAHCRGLSCICLFKKIF